MQRDYYDYSCIHSIPHNNRGPVILNPVKGQPQTNCNSKFQIFVCLYIMFYYKKQIYQNPPGGASSFSPVDK